MLVAIGAPVAAVPRVPPPDRRGDPETHDEREDQERGEEIHGRSPTLDAEQPRPGADEAGPERDANPTPLASRSPRTPDASALLPKALRMRHRELQREDR